MPRSASTHVGLNLLYLVPGETGGTEIVARELLPALLAEGEGVRFTLFLNRETAESGDGFWNELAPTITVPVYARRRSEWVRGEQQLLPPLARRAGVELVHSLGNTGPVWGRFRRVVTIHDLIHRIYPDAHFGLRSVGMRILVSLAARRSDRVIADSESTRDDMVRLLRLDTDKIDVAPLGVSIPSSKPLTPEAEIRSRLELGDRSVVLSVSAKRPHKNLMRLLEAHAGISVDPRPVLVLPGYPTPHQDELHRRAAELGIARDVRLLGWLPDEDLEGLYAAASCFVFPSLYEGFGLPVLEAMIRGVPVACSDRGSLKEVVGEAACLFDPESPRSIAGAVDHLLTDRVAAERLRVAGREQARRFTWEGTARATLASYDRALATVRSPA